MRWNILKYDQKLPWLRILIFRTAFQMLSVWTMSYMFYLKTSLNFRVASVLVAMALVYCHVYCACAENAAPSFRTRMAWYVKDARTLDMRTVATSKIHWEHKYSLSTVPSFLFNVWHCYVRIALQAKSRQSPADSRRATRCKYALVSSYFCA